jgi:hypothetical protein
MQLILAFLEAFHPQTKLRVKIDAEAHKEAIKVVARMIIAQSVETTRQVETTDD